MEKTDGNRGKKEARQQADSPDRGIAQILKSQSESTSILRVLSNTAALKEVSSSAADAGLFYNLEVMFSNVIHNGKNYLGPIKGYASLIQDDNDEGENTRGWADKIVRSVEQMEKYFELLSMYRVKGAIGVAPVSWHELINRVLDHYAYTNKRGLPIEITNNTSGTIRQHGELLKRVLVHLVTNAYESVRGDGKISLTISDRPIEHENGQKKKTIVQIHDTGCGIEEKNADLIWKPFYTTKHDHVGLGLPFVSMAAPILGMDVELHSKTGLGTTVKLVLTEQGG